MTRPLGLHDLGLLWDLRGQGITLDMQRALMATGGPLWTALSGLLSSGRLGTALTFVCSHSEAGGQGAEGFAQVMSCPERQEWQVIHLAPWGESSGLSGVGWVNVLADLCALAGAWGALRVRAGVPAGGAEEEAFRQAGFAAYAREEVYRLEQPRPAAGVERAVRAVDGHDAWRLIQLFDHVVPSAVQHAEGTDLSGMSTPVLARLGVTREQGFALEMGDAFGAYVGLSRGREGAWARILLHPDAGRYAADVIWQTIIVASPGPALYCAVRDYQAGLRSVLATMGFDFVGVQVWLVRHTTRPATYYRCRDLMAFDKRPEPVTSPLHPVNDVELSPCSLLTREHWMYEYRRTDRYAVRTN